MKTPSVTNITSVVPPLILPPLACGVNRLAHAVKYAEKQAKKRGRPAFIYLVECHDFVKVGIADDPKFRLMQLQIGCPYELRLLAAFKVINAETAERKLHALWKSFEVRGEWFRVPAGLLASAVNAESFEAIFEES